MTDSHPGGSSDPERTVYPCPACGRSADEVAGCTHCGRPVDVEAVAIMRLDLTIAGLTVDLHQARQATDRIAGQLGNARAMRADAVFQLGAKLRAEHARVQLRPKAPRQETTPRAVQAVLFVLGGILLGSAAIVFTTVAWASFGIAGRGAILVLLTVLTLAVGPLALRRGLSGTAETFAALGLLLVVLDGYAAWHVDLGGVSESLAPATYAGLVAAVTTVAALGYASGCAAAGSGPIVGPPLTGFLTAQGVLPLLLADRGLWAAGWSVAMAIMAVVNLGWAVLIGRRGRHLVRLRQTAAVILACCWTAIATLTGLLGLSTGGASGALRAAAAV
ncbi:MAG: hypothetical protein JXA67_20865, partial [Micromonosporaceae bacterium]|nr:hypothetical protein [Micromonosporaceae bacterium]